MLYFFNNYFFNIINICIQLFFACCLDLFNLYIFFFLYFIQILSNVFFDLINFYVILLLNASTCCSFFFILIYFSLLFSILLYHSLPFLSSFFFVSYLLCHFLFSSLVFFFFYYPSLSCSLSSFSFFINSFFSCLLL